MIDLAVTRLHMRTSRRLASSCLAASAHRTAWHGRGPPCSLRRVPSAAPMPMPLRCRGGRPKLARTGASLVLWCLPLQGFEDLRGAVWSYPKQLQLIPECGLELAAHGVIEVCEGHSTLEELGHFLVHGRV